MIIVKTSGYKQSVYTFYMVTKGVKKIFLSQTKPVERLLLYNYVISKTIMLPHLCVYVI